MTDHVNNWRQSGRFYVWRYAAPGKRRTGWHFTANSTGCASLIDLVERMKASGVTCHRTLSLALVTPEIWAVPNYGPPKHDRFDKLRINYAPETPDLVLEAFDERVEMNIGNARSTDLTAAFAEVAVGSGDFGIAASNNKHAETWMFWWMLNSQQCN